MRADSRQLSLAPRSSAQHKKMAMAATLTVQRSMRRQSTTISRPPASRWHTAASRWQTHASNVKEKQQHFRDALPQLISSASHAVVAVGMLWSQQQAQHMTELQGHIDQWQPVHHGCQQAGGGSSPAARVGTHNVLYTATHVSGHITVPDCQCTACGTRFPMPAPAAGCVERSHKRPNLWVDTRMCLLYHHLRDSGVAYDTWVSAITEHQSQHACAPSPAPWRAEPAPSPAAAPTAPTPAAHAAPSEGDGDEQAEAQHLGGDGGGCPVASDWRVADPGHCDSHAQTQCS